MKLGELEAFPVTAKQLVASICVNDGDRKMWLSTLKDAWQRTGWRIHAWVLEEGMRLLKLQDGDLAAMPKGQIEKQVLAWWLHGKTTVTRRWIAENLQMGYETRVSQAVTYIKSNRSRAVAEMKKILLDHDQ